VRAKEGVARIRDAEKEIRAAQRVIARLHRDDGAKGICFQLEFFGVGARANGRAEFRGLAPDIGS
jgi:hypothetical protein